MSEEIEKSEALDGGLRCNDRLGAVKLCLFCRHCEFEEGYALSEITWEPGSINCLKNFNNFCSTRRNDFAKWSRRAETCPYYEIDKDA